MRFALFLRRTAEVLVTLFLVTFVTYIFTANLPGSEASVICGVASSSCIQKENAVLGLNQPILERYFHWLGNLLTGNLGYSYPPPEPTSQLLAHCFSITLELVILSQIIAIVIAVPLAVYSALRPNRLFDRFSTMFSFATISLPAFIIGPILLWLFTIQFQIFPGAATPVPPFWSDPISNLNVMFLPALVVAISSIAVYQRLLRADMIATLEEDYIVMARAKGLTTKRILFRHAMRPSTFTVMTVGGLQIAGLIGGTVVVEVIFKLNGMGYQLVNAVATKDLPTVQIITVIIAVSYVVLNLIIDVLYGVVDPRVRRARA